MTDLDDWLENAIMDSIDLDWTPRDAARLIVSRMQAEGLVLINREGMRERVAEAISVERQNWGGSGTVVTYDRDLADAAVTAILGEG